MSNSFKFCDSPIPAKSKLKFCDYKLFIRYFRLNFSRTNNEYISAVLLSVVFGLVNLQLEPRNMGVGPPRPDELVVEFSSSVHAITTNGKTLTVTTQKTRHVKPDDPRSPVFEAISVTQAIGNKSVKTTDVTKGKETDSTTKCYGFDEKDLDTFEEEMKTLWHPLIQKKLVKN